MSVKYLKEFDGVRAVAALMVMIFHFLQRQEFVEGSFLFWARKAAYFGQTGVTLFFVLSGFLITRILLDARGKGDYFKAFYMRRVLRIFPLYYFFLLIYYLLIPLITGTELTSFSKQWYYWAYLQNFAITFNWDNSGPLHFWSLAVEEHFYLIWPLLVYKSNLRNLKWVVACIVILSAILRIILFSSGYEVFYFTFTTMDALALGALLALQERERGMKIDKRTNLQALNAVFVVSVLCIGATWFLFSGTSSLWVQVTKFLFVALLYYSALAILLFSPGYKRLKSLLSSRPFHFSGRISYGLYVYHPIVFLFYLKYLRTGVLVIDFLGAFVSSFTIAFLSYELIEKKFLELKRYFEYRIKKTPNKLSTALISETNLRS